MTDLRQAAQQALDFLTTRRMGAEAVITALNVALAQEHAMHDLVRLGQEIEQEPVAWMFQHDETGRMNYVSNDGRHTPDLFLKTNLRYALVCPLYTTSPQQQAEPPPEWLLIKNILDEYGLDAIAFVAEWKAAQRPWVGLTEEEVKHLYPYGRSVWGKETFEAIEKALKEKNT